MKGAFVAVLVFAIPAACVTQESRSAVMRGKLKRTMGDLRTIATAVESYEIAHGTYPRAQTVAELTPLLESTYIKTIPRVDGWGHAFEYRTWCLSGTDVVPGEPNTYILRSRGADGFFADPDPNNLAGGSFSLR